MHHFVADEKKKKKLNDLILIGFFCIGVLGGRLSAGINQEGIDYYNKIIDFLLAEG